MSDRHTKNTTRQSENGSSIEVPLLPYLCQPSSILGLILIGELLSLVLVLANTRASLSWVEFGSTSMVVQWIILCSALVLCQLRPLLNRLSPVASGSLAYSLCLLIAGLVLWAAHWLTGESFDGEFWVKSMLIAAIFAGILLRYLYLQQQLSNQQQAELQARIQSLQARIRPHFLFNSMNTIASLISIDPSAAEKTVEDLSDLFRSSLQKPGLVSLSDELLLCRRYIAIEQRRLGERLSMHWQYDEPLPNIDVPSLFLQPLLENAIYHGIQPLINGGDIVFTITVDDKVTIRIDNPISDNAAPQTDRGHQIALNNIQHRLELYYGKQATFDALADKNKKQYCVMIVLPLSINLPDKK